MHAMATPKIPEFKWDFPFPMDMPSREDLVYTGTMNICTQDNVDGENSHGSTSRIISVFGYRDPRESHKGNLFFFMAFDDVDKFDKLKLDGEFPLTGIIFSHEYSNGVGLEKKLHVLLHLRSTSTKDMDPSIAPEEFPCPSSDFTCFRGEAILVGVPYGHDEPISIYFYYNTKKNALKYAVFSMTDVMYNDALWHYEATMHVEQYRHTMETRAEHMRRVPLCFKEEKEDNRKDKKSESECMATIPFIRNPRTTRRHF